MRFLATLAFCLLGLSPAMAADKGGPAKAAPAAADTISGSPFDGLYAGVLLGHSTGQIGADGTHIPLEGWNGTGLLGYNRVLGSVLVGLEGDFGVTGLAGSFGQDGFTVKGSSKFLGSLRARVGLPYHNTLLYGTAGLAVTDAKIAVSDVGSDTKNTRGAVFGGGIEAFLFNNVGARLEVLRYQWVDQNFTIQDVSSGNLGSHETQVRGGVIIRLN